MAEEALHGAMPHCSWHPAATALYRPHSPAANQLQAHGSNCPAPVASQVMRDYTSMQTMQQFCAAPSCAGAGRAQLLQLHSAGSCPPTPSSTSPARTPSCESSSADGVLQQQQATPLPNSTTAGLPAISSGISGNSTCTAAPLQHQSQHGIHRDAPSRSRSVSGSFTSDRRARLKLFGTSSSSGLMGGAGSCSNGRRGSSSSKEALKLLLQEALQQQQPQQQQQLRQLLQQQQAGHGVNERLLAALQTAAAASEQQQQQREEQQAWLMQQCDDMLLQSDAELFDSLSAVLDAATAEAGAAAPASSAPAPAAAAATATQLRGPYPGGALNHPSPRPQTALETAQQVLALVATEVTPVLAEQMQDRLMGELAAAARTARALGQLFDFDAHLQELLPELRRAAAAALQLKRAAASARPQAAAPAGPSGYNRGNSMGRAFSAGCVTNQPNVGGTAQRPPTAPVQASHPATEGYVRRSSGAHGCFQEQLLQDVLDRALADAAASAQQPPAHHHHQQLHGGCARYLADRPNLQPDVRPQCDQQPASGLHFPANSLPGGRATGYSAQVRGSIPTDSGAGSGLSADVIEQLLNQELAAALLDTEQDY